MSLPRSAIRALRAHESAMDARDPALLPTSDSSDPLVPLTPALAAQLSSLASLTTRESELRAREASVAAREAALASARRLAALRSSCRPLTIGGRDGCDPSSLDIRVEPDPFDASRSIAWVPVPLYPLPIPDPKTPFFVSRAGEKIPNLVLGETRISESLAVASVLTNQPLPLPPSSPPSTLPSFRSIEVSLCGFARITVSRHTPEDVASRLSRRDSKARDESVSLPSDSDSERDALDAECTTPAFIPSAVSDPNARMQPSGRILHHT